MVSSDARSPSPGGSYPSVFIVVLNRHGRAYTLTCLQSLAAVAYPRTSLILIDNGCQDFSADEVARLLPGAGYLRSDVNLGFTGGVNWGIRHALGLGADYVFLLNNDTIIDPAALTELVSVAAADPHIGIVGAKLLQLDAPDRLESAGLRINLTTGRLYQIAFGERDTGQYDDTSDVAIVSGGAMLLRRTACERLGGFDDRYFRYLEDVDICLRARHAGFRVVLAPRARVYHKGKGMTGGQTSPLIVYYATRNQLLLMHDHAPRGRLLHFARAAIVLVLNAAYALREPGTRRARLRALWRAMRDYKRGALGAASDESTR